MKFFHFIWVMLGQMVEKIRSLPRLIRQAGEQRNQQLAKDIHEADRLDRICNPSKYLGK